MIKRRLLLLIAVVCVFGMTGCVSTIKLTEEENNIMAEYLAGVLLKQEDSYSQKLIELEPTPIPEPTSIPEPTVTPVTDKEPAAPSVGTNQGQNTTSNQQANADFTQVIGMEHLTIEYTGYEIASSFADQYFTLEASDKKDIIKVEFEAVNTSNQDISLKLSKEDINYQLDVNSGGMLKPLLTFMYNDLRHIDVTIGANKTEKAVVMFEINKGQSMDLVNLIISKGDHTAIVEIKY